MRLFALATLLFALGCTPDQPVALANLTGADALAGADLAVSPGADGQADLPSVIDVQDAADLQTDAWTDVVVDVPPDVAPDIPVNPCINKPCDDANPCTTDTCAAGQCLHAPVVDGIPCSDNNACTQPDFCNQGTCAGSLACDTHATCAPSSGCTCALGWFGSGWACQPWLSGISLNGTPLVGFADNVFAYAVQGSISVQTVTVMVDAPADVSLTVNGQALVSGVASAPVALNLGKNLLTIVATGPGGQATYTITVTRELGEQDAYVKASNTNTGDHFGSPMAISGDTLVVSAAYESSNATGINGNQADNSMLQSGAVYVFIRSGGVWSQQAYLKASNPGWQDYFGYSVAISGDTIVVGARFESSNATGINGDQTNDKAKMSGAAYVFVRSGTIWSQQAYLKASNTDKDDQFGWSVAISGDTVVVGAVGESSKASGVNGDQADNSLTLSGAAYVFVRTGSTWTQQCPPWFSL